MLRLQFYYSKKDKPETRGAWGKVWEGSKCEASLILRDTLPSRCQSMTILWPGTSPELWYQEFLLRLRYLGMVESLAMWLNSPSSPLFLPGSWTGITWLKSPNSNYMVGFSVWPALSLSLLQTNYPGVLHGSLCSQKLSSGIPGVYHE